ncbi:MAG: PQQ-binding-like beta-propeller repeat protein [Planctomycetota bacterium]
MARFAILRAASVIWAACAVAAAPARAGDWPQLLGPSRDGQAAADERLGDWPKAGPPLVWSREVGAGYAGVVVAGGRVYLFHRVADRELVEALDPATGETLWKDEGHATRFRPQVGGGDGPLCTPVVAGDRVLVFGASGTLACLDGATGRRHWVRETHRDYGAPEGYFGAGSTPLVVGDRVVVNVGGAKQEAGLVAFELATGETAWKTLADAASYAAPVAVVVAGRPHVLAVTRLACVLVDAATGELRWRFPFGQRGPTVNAATPLLLAADRLLVTAAYGVGTVCARFDAAGVEPLWSGHEALATQYATPLLVAGHLYAIDGRDDLPPADFKCLDPATGRVLWTERDFGYGTLIAADGKLVVAKTDGELLLVEPDPAALTIVSRCRPFGVEFAGAVRALPALSGGRLYLRDDRRLLCLAVGREPPLSP